VNSVARTGEQPVLLEDAIRDQRLHMLANRLFEQHGASSDRLRVQCFHYHAGMTPRAATACIFATVLIDIMGLGIILPVMPALIQELTGETLSEAARDGGWLWFTYASMQFLCAPILGGLSDRFGRRPVLLGSLLAFGLDYLVMGFAPSLAWLFAGRLIAGATGAAYATGFSYMADITPPEKRGQAFGLIGAAFGIGFVVGPAVGGLLGELGTRAPFFAAGGLALLNAAFGYFVLPESLPADRRRAFSLRRANPLGTLLQLRRHPAVLGLALATFFWQLGHQALPATWSFYTMLKFGWSPAAVGGSLAFVGVLMAISQGGLTRVFIPRFGERRVALAGLCTAVLAFVGYAFAPSTGVLYASMTLWLVAAMTYPSLNALMSQRVPADAQGELQGGVASLFGLSAIIGPPLMAQLFGYFSDADGAVVFPGASFLCAAVLTALSLAVFLRAVRGAPATGAPPAGT
jgi:MFS transporter, DHA1 family, tetracycline resistance protein